jgi:hypothetical protein
MILAAAMIAPGWAAGQTRIDIQQQARNLVKKGASLPAACEVGEQFFLTGAAAGRNLHLCTSANTWTAVAGGGGGVFTGENDFSAATSLILRRGSGAPAAAGCDSAGEIGSQYVDESATAGGQVEYVCARTGAGTYAWVRLLGADPATDGVAVGGALSVGRAMSGPLTVVASSSTPAFDTSLGNSFLLTLGHDVVSSTAPGGKPGQTIFISVCQPGGGTHLFVWPASFVGAAAVERTAGACTNQMFGYDGISWNAAGAAVATGATIGTRTEQTTRAASPAAAVEGINYCNVSGGCGFTLPPITEFNPSPTYCFLNDEGRAGVITITAPATTSFLMNGTAGAAAGTLASGGALGDSACVKPKSVTRYQLFTGEGKWCGLTSGGSQLCMSTLPAGVTSDGANGLNVAGGLAVGATVLDPTASVPACRKYTVTYTDPIFTASSASATKTIKALAAKEVLTGLRIKHSAPFSGTAVTSSTVSLGDGTTADVYAPAFNIFQPAGNATLWIDGGMSSTTAAAHNVVATFTANTTFGAGGVTALTAGAVELHLCTVVLP